MKPQLVGEGAKCPKCPKNMLRYEHKSAWQPKANQPYYFKYWDVCSPCRHTQLYESAKVYLKTEPKLYAQVIDQLRPAYVASGDRPPWED